MCKLVELHPQRLNYYYKSGLILNSLMFVLNYMELKLFSQADI